MDYYTSVLVIIFVLLLINYGVKSSENFSGGDEKVNTIKKWLLDTPQSMRTYKKYRQEISMPDIIEYEKIKKLSSNVTTNYINDSLL